MQRLAAEDSTLLTIDRRRGVSRPFVRCIPAQRWQCIEYIDCRQLSDKLARVIRNAPAEKVAFTVNKYDAVGRTTGVFTAYDDGTPADPASAADVYVMDQVESAYYEASNVDAWKRLIEVADDVTPVVGHRTIRSTAGST